MQKVSLRLCLLCFAWFALGLVNFGCGPEPPSTCKPDDRVSDFTVNPSGTRCKYKCECNNQVYTGFCNEQGICDSQPRGDCPKPGALDGCFVRPKPKKDGLVCPSGAGIRTCKPDYLRLQKWGDCELLNKVTDENDPKTCGDGIDNDCDGKVDRSDDGCREYCFPGETRSCYVGDPKTENIGTCAPGRLLCDPATGRWPDPKTFCRFDVRPRPEVCNGKDDDCNGKVDDGLPKCVCAKENDTQPCYTGPHGTENIGVCKTGTRTCQKVDGNLYWGECKSEKLPKKTEECNNIDDNCNGLVDEDCACLSGQVRSCGTSTGLCRKGEQRCMGGRWSKTCYGEVYPVLEECDNQDNNCNGLVDEYINPEPCRTACGKGIASCKGGKMKCEGPQPKDETCDNTDEDCDGRVDGFVKSCTSTCGPGSRACVKGAWGPCVPNKVQSEECNGKDDDCNGKVDDGLAKSCQTKCGTGGSICVSGKWVCYAPEPRKEICDGVDNDCNGKVDDSPQCKCQPGAVQDCSRSKGACVRKPDGTLECKGNCQAGKQVCVGGQWGPCIGEVLPQREICDGKDNDCDGKVDNQLTRTCYSGQWGCRLLPDGKYSCQSPCRAGSQTCAGGKWSACAGEALPQKEVCDGKDNDCNGRIDDALVQACKSNCGAGIEFCKTGVWVNCTAPQPQKERCNGIDDDCNGKTDDNIPQTACLGVCGKGKITCENGVSLCKVSSLNQELCNGIDDDCNGQVDDKFPEKGKPCLDKSKAGECQRGTYTACSGGKLVCTGGQPTVEICDGKDNDCDGKLDNGVNGCVTTVAGTCRSKGNLDGDALKAKLLRPSSALWARVYNPTTKKEEESVLIVDFGNHRIRRLDLTTGKVETWAGSTSGFLNGARQKAKFSLPEDIAGPDEFGNFFVGEAGNHHIRQINKSGVVSSFSGIAGLSNGGFSDGSAQVSKFNNPRGLFVRKGNVLLVADHNNQRIREVSRSGSAGTVVGQKWRGFTDGNFSVANFSFPSDIVALDAELFYMVETGNSAIRFIDSKNRKVSTVAGGTRGFKNGTGRNAQFSTPLGIALSSKGDLYIADTGNHCIRKVTRAGVVTTAAGVCTSAGYKDGSANKALFNFPQRISFDSSGNLYVADSENHCIRRVSLP